MPDTRPDIVLDETGRCPACVSYDRRQEIDWQKRGKDLSELIDRHGGRVLVPSSGGKDSTFQAIYLKKLGADVTCVTARTCDLSRVGRANIDNLARHVKTIEVVPNMAERAELNRLGLELVGDISWPEHVAIFTTPFRVALETGHTLIMYGENPQNQYGGPPGSEEAALMTQRWVSEFGGFLGLRVSDMEGMGYDMEFYRAPRPDAIASAGIEAHFLGHYLPWDSVGNAEFSARHGFSNSIHGYDKHVPPPYAGAYWRHENLDNRQTAIHDYFMLLKYGYSRACSQLSVDIRAGRISRSAALKILQRIEGRFPLDCADSTTRQVLSRIGVGSDEILHWATVYCNPDLFSVRPSGGGMDVRVASYD